MHYGNKSETAQTTAEYFDHDMREMNLTDIRVILISYMTQLRNYYQAQHD